MTVTGRLLRPFANAWLKIRRTSYPHNPRNNFDMLVSRLAAIVCNVSNVIMRLPVSISDTWPRSKPVCADMSA